MCCPWTYLYSILCCLDAFPTAACADIELVYGSLYWPWTCLFYSSLCYLDMSVQQKPCCLWTFCLFCLWTRMFYSKPELSLNVFLLQQSELSLDESVCTLPGAVWSDFIWSKQTMKNLRIMEIYRGNDNSDSDSLVTMLVSHTRKVVRLLLMRLTVSGIAPPARRSSGILTHLGGHHDFSPPLRPHPLIRVEVGRRQQCGDDSFISKSAKHQNRCQSIKASRHQSSLNLKAKCLLKITT
jgi:hypothetical protein